MKLIIFIPVLLSFHLGLSQELGDKCQPKGSKSEGKCILLQDCPKALNGLQKGKLPKICGYRDLEAIICCPTKLKVSMRVQKLKLENPNRISRQKCAEYGKSVFQIIPSMGMREMNISTCASEDDPTLSRSIYAREREFPHMALVGGGPKNDKQWICSGSLISDQYVLTVAHCTMNHFIGALEWVRLGDLDFISPNDDNEFLDISILNIHRHPKYRPPVLYNDIALLQLDRKVPFSDHIRPACLHSGSDVMLDQFIITGWALVTADENKGHLRQYKQLKKMNNKRCNTAYENISKKILKKGIVEDLLLCTEKANNDACQISSGAALQVNNKDVYCMFDIVGITSFSRGFCSSQPVVHTRVSAYIDWIESIVWPQVTQM